MAGRVKNYSICQEVKIADEVLYKQADGVATLTLNRPEKYSTLRGDIFQVLGEALQRANTDEEVKAIILRGSGDAFVAVLTSLVMVMVVPSNQPSPFRLTHHQPDLPEIS